MRHFLLVSLLLASSATVFAQKKTIQATRFLPKDTARYAQLTGLDYQYGDDTYGQTELVIHCPTAQGTFEFVFNKKLRKLERFIEYKEGPAVSQIYSPQTGQWSYEEGSARPNGRKAMDTIHYSDHDLYAFVLVEDHGGVVEKARFRDYGNVVYWPEFEYEYCSVSDEDHDGSPEFYLTYFANSDGLDPKELKQIIYTAPATPAKGLSFIKSKATAYYPVEEQPGAGYRTEYDSNWKLLPELVKRKSNRILQEYKKSSDFK